MRKDACKHYAGMDFSKGSDGGKCEADVAFKDVMIPGSTSIMFRLPCFGRCKEAKCDKKELPTADEIAAFDVEFKKSMVRTMTARAAIGAATKYKRGVVGEIPCPICTTGKLRYSVAKSNGHIHAACSTESCVSWME